MGCAVHTTLAAGVGYTTTDLQVRYIRAMSDVDRARAAPRAASCTPAGARRRPRDALFAESDEKLIAHGSTGCTIFA